MEKSKRKPVIWPERDVYHNPHEIMVSTNYRFEYNGKKYSTGIISKKTRGQAFPAFTADDVNKMILSFEEDMKKFYVRKDGVAPIYSPEQLIKHPNTAIVDE